jgi:hypothetical protein
VCSSDLAEHVWRAGIASEPELGLGEEEPAAGTAAARAKVAIEVGGGFGSGRLMPNARAGRGVQHARDDLSAHPLGERGLLFVQAQKLLGGGHRNLTTGKGSGSASKVAHRPCRAKPRAGLSLRACELVGDPVG